MAIISSRASRYEGAASARATLARAVGLITTAIAVLLVLGILVVVLGANRSNDIVSFLRDAASTLAGPLDGLFKLDSNKAEKAVNWGLAAVAWLAIGRIVARLLLRR
jgi:hypothetical protein